MDKVNMVLFDKKGKKKLEFSWPVMSLTKIKESKLTSEQKKLVKKTVIDQIELAKTHFGNDGAWNLDMRFLYDEVVEKLLGFSLSDLLITQVCAKADVTYGYIGNKSLFVNLKDKAFYNPIKNKIYVDTIMRNSDTDIQLGDL